VQLECGGWIAGNRVRRATETVRAYEDGLIALRDGSGAWRSGARLRLQSGDERGRRGIVATACVVASSWGGVHAGAACAGVMPVRGRVGGDAARGDVWSRM